MSKTQGCLDRVSFWRKALAAVLLIIFASAVSPGRADDGLQPVKLTESDYSMFWADTGIIRIYGYGTPCNLSDLFDFLSAVEHENPRFVNPMKSMPMVHRLGYWASSWNYLEQISNPGYGHISNFLLANYCTDFVAALIILRFLSFSDAFELVNYNSDLNYRWQGLWKRFSGPCTFLLFDHLELLAQEGQYDIIFVTKDRELITFRLFVLLFNEEYIRAACFAQAIPLADPHSSYYEYLRYKPFYEFEMEEHSDEEK